MGSPRKQKPERKAMQNREISWLAFNSRVQSEADNLENPLLERAKFLGIVTSNMDEFFQVRYHALVQAAQGHRGSEKQQARAEKLYLKVNKTILRQSNRQYMLYEGSRSELFAKGVQLFPTFPSDPAVTECEKRLFEKEIFPYLRVETLEDARIRQKQLYFCVKLVRRGRKAPRFKVVALPTSLPRLFDVSGKKDVQCLIALEDIVKHHICRLFPREEVEHLAVWRILRNQDYAVHEETCEDIVPAVREMLAKRTSGAVTRLEAEERMSEEMLTLLMKRFRVPREQCYRVTGPLDLNKLMMALYGLVKRPQLKYPAVQPVEAPELMGKDIFAKIDWCDWLLYHPYHSFAPVVNLMERAAEDESVRAIRQTLYRVSANSPIVAALCTAAQNGKDVLVLLEAHARFDEENNLYWGEKLQRAGCRVLYGLPNLKVHSKITLIEREEEGRCRRTLHLGTGNYHDGTAKLYTDFGLLTSDEELTGDAVAFFAMLEGYEGETQALIQAPNRLCAKLIELIQREADHARQGRPARILAKMNSLSDKRLAAALIEASRAGVEINLIVRGICTLKPEREGVTENIHVRSIVGRHLEHARAFVFENGGEHEVYLSSADWMPRNLSHRVELMFPVKDAFCQKAVENVLTLQWQDTQKARLCNAKGEYELFARTQGGRNAQETLLANIAGVFDGSEVLPIGEPDLQS